MTNVLSAPDFIRTLDPRDMPRYSIGEAAVYLGLPESTVRAWFVGTTYGSQPNVRRFHPVLTPASRDLLSFFDIASAHILVAFKRRNVAPDALRAIIASLRKEFPDDRYPLLGKNFFMFGKDVVLKQLGQRLNLNRGRQLGMRKIMDKFLARVEVDPEDMPIRFSPLRDERARGKGFIVIDPQLSSGRPVVRGSGIAAEIISERRKSGESIAGLAKDYRMSRRAIEEAVGYFAQKKQPEHEPCFLLDRNLGRYQLALQLRAAGLNVVAGDDRYSENERDPWIFYDCGKQGNVVITADKEFMKSFPHMAAISLANTTVIAFTSNNYNSAVRGKAFIKAIAKVRRALVASRGVGFIASVGMHGGFSIVETSPTPNRKYCDERDWKSYERVCAAEGVNYTKPTTPSRTTPGSAQGLAPNDAGVKTSPEEAIALKDAEGTERAK